MTPPPPIPFAWGIRTMQKITELETAPRGTRADRRTTSISFSGRARRRKRCRRRGERGPAEIEHDAPPEDNALAATPHGGPNYVTYISFHRYTYGVVLGPRPLRRRGDYVRGRRLITLERNGEDG
ncbi:hypothetical protein EVAR_92745_1 [Eumeta japonica]|uniref:Uncharacterized protein n=1 Tax=Eumeta variegata TaxID=151549 RepID=A0A4C1SX55_EUMVA|nr:hypothetical protein EVAR_92745_1 [Eumeta japonica]